MDRRPLATCAKLRQGIVEAGVPVGAGRGLRVADVTTGKAVGDLLVAGLRGIAAVVEVDQPVVLADRGTYGRSAAVGAGAGALDLEGQLAGGCLGSGGRGLGPGGGNGGDLVIARLDGLAKGGGRLRSRADARVEELVQAGQAAEHQQE